MADATSRALPSSTPGLGRFLAAASPFLGAALAAQWRHAPLVVCGTALVIFSRGALDVPARALVVVAGSIALVMAAADARSMWTQLIASKKWLGLGDAQGTGGHLTRSHTCCPNIPSMMAEPMPPMSAKSTA